MLILVLANEIFYGKVSFYILNLRELLSTEADKIDLALTETQWDTQWRWTTSTIPHNIFCYLIQFGQDWEMNNRVNSSELL